jgi:hypothetical protein
MAAAEQSPGGGRREALFKRLTSHPPRPRYAAAVIVAIWLALTLLFGWLEHVVDDKTFPTVWLGLWWAMQTVTTVGYGDVVPKQTVGRLMAAVLMLGGLSLLTVLTATITSTFVARAQSAIREREGDPVAGRLDALTAEVHSLRDEVARLSR